MVVDWRYGGCGSGGNPWLLYSISTAKGRRKVGLKDCHGNSINQILKLRTNMRRYSRADSEPIPKDSPIIERQLLTPRTPVHPIIIRKEETPSEDDKFTMEQLCRSFLQRFEDKADCEFEARELIELTGVKQRRIYDLMNILEGCGLLQRVAKGKYLWFGFGAQGQGRARAKEATSLSCLAARVKEILHTQHNFVDFKEICSRVLAEGSEDKINPNSIKRRVYECWIIAKKDHTFRWVSEQERRQKPLERTEDTLKAGESQQKRREEQLMQELLRDVNSQQTLQALLTRIRDEFSKRSGVKKLFSEEL